MNDIVERLRAYAKDQGGWHIIDETCEQAADALASLSARLAECEAERDEARRHHQEYLLSYINNVKTIAERFKLEPSELQLQWRQGKRTDRSEVEWAIDEVAWKIGATRALVILVRRWAEVATPTE